VLIVMHPRAEPCHQSCDVLTVHLVADGEIHLFPDTASPERLAARLISFARELIENPTSLAALARETSSAHVVRRDL